MWTRLFAAPLDLHALALALVPAIGVAYLAARLARQLAAAALRSALGESFAPSSPHVRRPLRFITAAAFVLILGILAFPAFEMAGLRPRTGVHLRTLGIWTFGAGLRVVLIVAIAYALVRLTQLLVRRFEHEMTLGTGLDALERAKRARTLGSVVSKAVTVIVAGIATLMVLREFQVDVAPALTGAGILGLAVGFGAQTLVRDVISGFFLILENQVRVGDVAAINGIGGLVEAINLRTIVLRDLEGTVHVVPNGAIATLANRSKDFSYYVVDLNISYYDDPDTVAAVLRDVGASLQKDERFGPFILDAIEVLGVEGFGEWAVQMKARIKTMPQKQWDVGRELRRRILQAFAANGFAIPFPVQATAVRPEAKGR
jgi:small-conductance mechanosensitive channel